MYSRNQEVPTLNMRNSKVKNKTIEGLFPTLELSFYLWSTLLVPRIQFFSVYVREKIQAQVTFSALMLYRYAIFVTNVMSFAK